MLRQPPGQSILSSLFLLLQLPPPSLSPGKVSKLQHATHAASSRASLLAWNVSASALVSVFVSVSVLLSSLSHSRSLAVSSPLLFRLSTDTRDARVINPCGFLFPQQRRLRRCRRRRPRVGVTCSIATPLSEHCITSIIILTDSSRRAVTGLPIRFWALLLWRSSNGSHNICLCPLLKVHSFADKVSDSLDIQL